MKNLLGHLKYRLNRYLMGGIKIESLFFAVVSYHRIGYLFEKREMP